MEKRITKTYDQEFKSQAVKLAQEIGGGARGSFWNHLRMGQSIQGGSLRS